MENVFFWCIFAFQIGANKIFLTYARMSINCNTWVKNSVRLKEKLDYIFIHTCSHSLQARRIIFPSALCFLENVFNLLGFLNLLWIFFVVAKFVTARAKKPLFEFLDTTSVFCCDPFLQFSTLARLSSNFWYEHGMILFGQSYSICYRPLWWPPSPGW